MELIIGPYKVSQRTSYSKILTTDNQGNLMDSKIGEKIIDDYIKQTTKPEKYFEIDNHKITKFLDKGEIEYLFIPDDITQIASSVFEGSKIRFAYIPDSLNSVKSKLFADCKELKEITLPKLLPSLSNGIFDGCQSLKKVILPEKIKEIPLYAFAGCTSLEEINLPNSVTVIDDHSFQNCKSLKKINIPKEFESFGLYPFGNSNIETLVFNYDLAKTDYPKMFYKDFLVYSNIYRIEISENVKYIDPNLFNFTKSNITQIDYQGNKHQFKNFKKNNKKLLNSLKYAKVNLNDDLEKLITNEENITNPEKSCLLER